MLLMSVDSQITDFLCSSSVNICSVLDQICIPLFKALMCDNLGLGAQGRGCRSKLHNAPLKIVILLHKMGILCNLNSLAVCSKDPIFRCSSSLLVDIDANSIFSFSAILLIWILEPIHYNLFGHRSASSIRIN